MTVSKSGSFIVSGAHDRSIRVWDQTQEQVFLEEEREKEMEAVFDAVRPAQRTSVLPCLLPSICHSDEEYMSQQPDKLLLALIC
jgi:WD40 repeat protein